MSNKLELVFKKMEDKLADLRFILLTTSDGFNICNYVNGRYKIDEEKISAVTSSLCALSNAASKQLLNSELIGTNIETEKGTMLLVNTSFEGKDCVLCVTTGSKENIGHARYYTNRLARYIQEQ